MDVRRRVVRGLRALLLLLAGVTILLGGLTAQRVGRINHPDGFSSSGEVRSTGIAVVRSCGDRRGPISWDGFGYTWRCVVGDAQEEVEPGRYERLDYIGPFEASELAPEDVGRRFRYVEVFSPCTTGRFTCTSANWSRHRAEPPQRVWLWTILWAAGMITGGPAITVGGMALVAAVATGLAAAVSATPAGRWMSKNVGHRLALSGAARTRRVRRPTYRRMPSDASPAALVLDSSKPFRWLCRLLGWSCAAVFALFGLYGWLAKDNPRDVLVGGSLSAIFLGFFLTLGVAVGRACVVVDRDRVWVHTGWRWRAPIRFQDVAAVRYVQGRDTAFLTLVQSALERPAAQSGRGSARRPRQISVPLWCLNHAALGLLGPPLLRRTEVEMDEPARAVLRSGHGRG